MRVAVFYVWVPGERFKAHTAAFARSYKRHPAGVEHDLVMLCKGDRLPRTWPALPAVTATAVGTGGFDLGPFLRLAPAFADYDRLVLLGAYSRLLADGWLAKLTAAGPLASATGSFEVRPHLRTNCISVDPRLLHGIPVAQTKQECWDFEHGEQSIYRRAQEQDVDGVVVGADGECYEERDWPRSETYKTAGQENLLCADNHTDAYAKASPAKRKELQRRAWGARIGGSAPITVLTVTIPGRERTVTQTLESVYAQTVPVARQLLVAHRGGGPTPQVGYSQAKNDLLAAVDTEWVAVLNDDDVWLAEHVQTVLGELADADVVYTWDAGGTRPRVDANRLTQAQIQKRLETGNFLDGNCLIRTAMLRQVGGFPTDWVGGRDGHYAGSPATFEDWELWRRLARAGARFRCVPVETWRYGVSAPGRLSA